MRSVLVHALLQLEHVILKLVNVARLFLGGLLHCFDLRGDLCATLVLRLLGGVQAGKVGIELFHNRLRCALHGRYVARHCGKALERALHGIVGDLLCAAGIVHDAREVLELAAQSLIHVADEAVDYALHALDLLERRGAHEALHRLGERFEIGAHYLVYAADKVGLNLINQRGQRAGLFLLIGSDLRDRVYRRHVGILLEYLGKLFQSIARAALHGLVKHGEKQPTR